MIPEREESGQGIENLFEEITTENFPNLVEQKDIQVQEARRAPMKMNPKRLTPRHITIKMAKFEDKERILKSAREKQSVTYKGAPIKPSTDLSTETPMPEGIGMKFSK